LKFHNYSSQFEFVVFLGFVEFIEFVEFVASFDFIMFVELMGLIAELIIFKPAQNVWRTFPAPSDFRIRAAA